MFSQLRSIHINYLWCFAHPVGHTLRESEQSKIAHKHAKMQINHFLLNSLC